MHIAGTASALHPVSDSDYRAPSHGPEMLPAVGVIGPIAESHLSGHVR